MEHQLSIRQAQLFAHLVNHLQATVDPIIREACEHLKVNITIQDVPISLPLPYAADLQRTHKEVQDTYLEARYTYRFLMFLSDTHTTTEEMNDRMSREVQLIPMSAELYEGLCEIAGQCPPGEHTNRCPKAYVTMKIMTYWYLFQVYYMFLNQRLSVQYRVMGVNPVTALRHREITGVCKISKKVNPQMLKKITIGYLHERADIKQLLT